jgi:hypothetical protein
MIIFVFILQLQADVKSLLHATDSIEITRFHKNEVSNRLLKERCNVELRKQWMPYHCFEWLEQSSMSDEEKKKWSLNLEKKCIVAVQKAVAEGREERLFKKRKLSRVCLTSLEPAFMNWRYRIKGSAKADFETLEFAEQIGKDFERLGQHESEGQRRHRRIQNNEASGRRFN